MHAVIVVVAIVAALAAAAPQPVEFNPGPGWTLVWSDEFTSPTINTDNWTYDIGGPGAFGNDELETYTNHNAFINTTVSDGVLVIEARRNDSGAAYTSGRLKTEGLQAFKFGRFVASIVLPYGKGIWPAFWTLGSSITTVSWPTCGEIDIMELVGGTTPYANGDSLTHFTSHWNTQTYPNVTEGSYGTSQALTSGIFADGFHLFEAEWNETVIIGRLDNVQMYVMTLPSPTWANGAFNAPHFMILNVAVGGTWPGTPDSTTVFPQQMLVDYVRVYQPSKATVASPTPSASASPTSANPTSTPTTGHATPMSAPFSAAALVAAALALVAALL